MQGETGGLRSCSEDRSILAASLNVILNVILIPRLGILGAAWATVAGYTLMAILGGILSARLYPIPFEWPRLARVLAASALSYAVAALAPQDLKTAIAVKALAILAFPAALYFLGFFRDDEIQWMKSRLRSKAPVRERGG